MASKRRHEGYLLIDHANSPGVPESMVRDFTKRTGKYVPQVGEGATFESATITCAHCHAGFILNPGRDRERGYCMCCDHYICDNPGCNRECTPFTKLLDVAMERTFKAEAITAQTLSALRRDILGVG